MLLSPPYPLHFGNLNADKRQKTELIIVQAVWLSQDFVRQHHSAPASNAFRELQEPILQVRVSLGRAPRSPDFRVRPLKIAEVLLQPEAVLLEC